MHLVLINPPFTFLRRSEIAISQCLGILYVASYAHSKGHQITVVDGFRQALDNVEVLPDGPLKVGLSNQEIVSRIPKGVEMIGVSVPFSHLAPIGHSLIGEIKKARGSVPIVMGGVYPSTQPELALESLADYIVLGEGEVPTCELMEYLHEGKGGPLPQGVVSKTDPAAIKNVSPFRTTDVDALPIPGREFVPFEKYLKRSQRNIRGWRSASILTSRGCPFDCEFCSVHPVCGYHWRPRSAKRVLDEIDELVENYGVNFLEFEDDNFALKRDRAVEILEGIKERNRSGRTIHWGAFNGLRIDTLDEGLMKLISQSNGRQIFIALEHGDKDVLKSMNKKISLTKTLEVVRLAHQFGIRCNVFTIYGYPGETRERFENALSFYMLIKRVAPSVEFEFFIAQPYPGTKLFERMVREGWLPPDLFSTVERIRRFSTEEAVWIETPDFDRAEVLRRGKILRKTLLGTRAYLRYQLKRVLPDSLVDSLRSVYHTGKRIEKTWLRT